MFQLCTKTSHLKQHGSFLIAVFLQLAKLRYQRKNLQILDSRKLELFCLAKIAEGTEVSSHFQIICWTPNQCCYLLNPLNAHG